MVLRGTSIVMEMVNTMKMTKDLKDQVEWIVKKFNLKNKTDYRCRFRRGFVYLDRSDQYGGFGPVSRLKYTGKLDDWDFAIFKYSSEFYAEGEIFPGGELLDGTIDGALKAGLKAYP